MKIFVRNRKESPLELTQQRNKRLDKSDEPLWEATDFDKQHYQLPYLSEGDAYAKIDVSKVSNHSRRADIFRNFYSDKLLQQIWDHYDVSRWAYSHHSGIATVNHGAFNLSGILILLAVKIRIIAIQNAPRENKENHRPLRGNLQEALDHFTEIDPKLSVGRSHLELLLPRFTVPADLLENLSQNFQSVLTSLGRIVCGDEKLYHFTGESEFIRLIPSKPGHIGFWFYELCVLLGANLVFMIHIKLQTTTKSDKLSKKKTVMFVRIWMNIMIAFRANLSVLFYDSYYGTNEAREMLREYGILYVSACKESNFRNLTDQLSNLGGTVSRAGDTAAMYNQEYGELFICHMQNNDKKYSLGNAMVPCRSSRSKAGDIFGWDLYAFNFKHNDIFNRNLHDKSWCHKVGGRDRAGEEGHIDDYALAVTLQNTFSVFKAINPGIPDVDFLTHATTLADEIFVYAMSL